MPERADMPGDTTQAEVIKSAAKRVAENSSGCLSGDECANFLASLGDLHVRVGLLEGRADMLNDSIQKSNELHEAHREALDRMTGLLSEVKDMLEIYNSAKSAITVIGWFTSSIRRLAFFLSACAVIYTLYKTGSLSAILPHGE
jgi:hypothetical protein